MCAFRESSDKPKALAVWLAGAPIEELEKSRKSIWLGILGSRVGFSEDLRMRKGYKLKRPE